MTYFTPWITLAVLCCQLSAIPSVEAMPAATPASVGTTALLNSEAFAPATLTFANRPLNRRAQIRFSEATNSEVRNNRHSRFVLRLFPTKIGMTMEFGPAYQWGAKDFPSGEAWQRTFRVFFEKVVSNSNQVQAQHRARSILSHLEFEFHAGDTFAGSFQPKTDVAHPRVQGVVHLDVRLAKYPSVLYLVILPMLQVDIVLAGEMPFVQLVAGLFLVIKNMSALREKSQANDIMAFLSSIPDILMVKPSHPYRPGERRAGTPEELLRREMHKLEHTIERQPSGKAALSGKHLEWNNPSPLGAFLHQTMALFDKGTPDDTEIMDRLVGFLHQIMKDYNKRIATLCKAYLNADPTQRHQFIVAIQRKIKLVTKKTLRFKDTTFFGIPQRPFLPFPIVLPPHWATLQSA